MPPLSSWNTPFVSPRHSRANVAAIVERELERIDPLAGRLLDQVDGLAQDRQVAQAEEVHLQQTGRLDVPHRPLRDDVFLARDAAERHVVGQRPVGDHDGGRVRADVAGQSLELHRQVEQLADLAIRVVHLLQIRAQFQRLVQRDVQLLRHHAP